MVPTLDTAKHSPLHKIGMLLFVLFPGALLLFCLYAIGAIAAFIWIGLTTGFSIGTDWLDRMADNFDDYRL